MLSKLEDREFEMEVERRGSGSRAVQGGSVHVRVLSGYTERNE